MKRLSQFLTVLSLRYIPDPFVIALALTLVTFVAAFAFTDTPFLVLVNGWMGESGFFQILRFAMQIALMLLTGQVFASSPIITKGLRKIAAYPQNSRQAAILTAFVAIFCSLLHWCLGLIVGAILAKEIGYSFFQRKKSLNYPLIVAAGYTSLLTWHSGLSGSAPLKATTIKDQASILGDTLANQIGAIPISETIFSNLNLIVIVLSLIVLPVGFWLMSSEENERMLDESYFKKHDTANDNKENLSQKEITFASRIENSSLLVFLISSLGIIYLVNYFYTYGINAITFDTFNLIFLFFGLLFHKTVKNYLASVNEAISGCAGILIQYPFYSGIMGIMSVSGLVAITSNLFVQISTPATLPFFTFLSAGFLNVFIPSGGGQWAIQAPIVMQSAQTLGVDYGKMIMAFAYGDQWTNMIQPFWTLPLLGITRISAKEIIGYTGAIMLLSTLVFGIPLLIL